MYALKWLLLYGVPALAQASHLDAMVRDDNGSDDEPVKIFTTITVDWLPGFGSSTDTSAAASTLPTATPQPSPPAASPVVSPFAGQGYYPPPYGWTPPGSASALTNVGSGSLPSPGPCTIVTTLTTTITTTMTLQQVTGTTTVTPAACKSSDTSCYSLPTPTETQYNVPGAATWGATPTALVSAAGGNPCWDIGLCLVMLFIGAGLARG